MYEVKFTNCFLEHASNLGTDSRGLLEQKIKLIKINPHRYKRLVGYGLFLFRIWLSDNNKVKRAVYLVDSGTVIFICILNRSDDYADLKKYLIKTGFL
jgi:hypothetical protein